MTSLLKETYFISAGDTDAQGELSLSLLVARIIDIATAHANSLGIGNPSMEHDHKGWVLSRLTVEMMRYPRVNSFYSIETWVESWNRRFSERSFRILSADGETLGYARSVWMVMDTVTHENGGLAHLSLPEGVIIEGQNPIERQQRHVMICDDPAVSDSDLPRGALRSNRPTAFYRFEYCDLDAYRHVNTVRYVNLLMNQYSLEEFDASYVRRLELSFLHEGHYGQRVAISRHDSVGTLDNESVSSFLISDAGDAGSIVFARLMRVPRL